MQISLLDLITTPMAVLNSLGLRTRVGLSSDDPMARRHKGEAYQAYLSVYSPEGMLLERLHLGEIPPNRRRLFDVTDLSRKLVPGQDHLAVAHRIPNSLLSQVSGVEDSIELQAAPDFHIYRSMLEYSYSDGGNGSVIYETPPGLNGPPREGRKSNTLTFTCQIAISATVQTHIVLVHHSVNPSYSNIANFSFGLFSVDGERVATENVALGPFSVRAVDVASIIPRETIQRDAHPQDGQSVYTFVGACEDAVVIPLFVNAAPDIRAVAVEHTHPPQAYLLPADVSLKQKVKSEAASAWKSVFSMGRRS
ncbi:MAG: hypothetical protein FI731_04160 [SAR202 cluster bacterium]|nr:hypothetical protein [SAR202 cluster bacterium]